MVANNQPQEIQGEMENTTTGCLGEMGWLASGSVLPLASLTFFRRASKKPVGTAILFFFIFTSIITVLSTINVGVSMGTVTSSIRQAFEDGSMPEIIIRDGVTEIDMPGPVILFDEVTNGSNTFVAIDITGSINEVDRFTYTQGILLTRTTLHVYNDGEYQVLPLRELHTVFDKNPIIINSDTVTNAWQLLSVGFTIIAFIFIFLWHAIIRLMILAMCALILWGIVSIIRPKTKFNPIIISGLYAVVPAIYLTYLFSRIKINFPGLQTILLLPIWILAIVASLSSATFFSEDRPFRLWTALVGLPLIVVFCIDKIINLSSPGGPIIIWGTTFFTVIILVGLRLFYRYQEQQLNTVH